MKKIIASAVGLALVGGVAVTTASAVESQFGGYWRTRAFFQDNFAQDADNDANSSYNRTDTRTRLYYTAKFNDNFKFVNKFEFNTIWGDANGGDIGADGDTFLVKNSYADFTLGTVNAKVGIQGTTLSRGFAFDDDFSGVILTGDFDTVKVPVYYISGRQEDAQSATTASTPAELTELAPGLVDENGNVLDDNDNPIAAIKTTPALTGDYHIFATNPSFMVGDAVKLTPTAIYATITEEDTDIYWVGADVDLKLDAVSAWGTFLYNGGQLEDNDISAWLVAGGAEVSVVHGQAFYATGDDLTDADTDIDGFVSAPGQSYYWSEIMGLGIFDGGQTLAPGVSATASPNAPGDQISNIAAFNLGVTLKPMDKLTLNLDAWYAMLAEDNAAGEDELGTEIDAKLTYELMDNLNADVVFAYLFAGDATGPEDVMEGGVRLSLKF